MKLRINGFENEINLNDNKVNLIQIDNPKLLVHIIETINEKINELENNEIILLNDNNEELNFSKEVILIFDVFNIDYNSRKYINKIYEYIKDNIELAQDGFIDKLNDNIRRKILSELNELPFNFSIKDSVDIIDLLKVYNIKIDQYSYMNVLERLELLIEIMSVLDIGKVLIIPNLKSYMIEEDLLELYKYALYNNISLIILEKQKSKKLKYEQILSIDNEFDENIN